jgi:hypothetical protein
METQKECIEIMENIKPDLIDYHCKVSDECKECTLALHCKQLFELNDFFNTVVKDLEG